MGTDQNLRIEQIKGGAALLIIEELIQKYGLDPEVIASMAKSDKAMTLRI